MVAANWLTVRYEGESFTYDDACRLAARLAASGCRPVAIRFEGTTRTSTAALARLIVLRRRLLRMGQDLRIAGLRGQADGVYQIGRMSQILPRIALPCR